MIVQIPATTEALWSQLEAAVKEMPKGDRDLFLLDLMKFVTEWQFAYLAYEAQQHQVPRQNNPLKPL